MWDCLVGGLHTPAVFSRPVSQVSLSVTAKNHVYKCSCCSPIQLHVDHYTVVPRVLRAKGSFLKQARL